MVLALGGMAFTGLRRLLAATGERRRVVPEVHPSVTSNAEFTLHGTSYTALHVAHPSLRNKHGPSYEGAHRALAALLGVRRSGTPSVVRSLVHTAAPPGQGHSGRVVGLHFVCRGSLNVRDLPDGSFETGVWVVADQHARSAQYVPLHQSKAAPSYRQGRVRGYRTVIYEGRRRIVFHVDPDPDPLPWVGQGSGEKGYRYG